jgi:hypothetical protein
MKTDQFSKLSQTSFTVNRENRAVLNSFVNQPTKMHAWWISKSCQANAKQRKEKNVIYVISMTFLHLTLVTNKQHLVMWKWMWLPEIFLHFHRIFLPTLKNKILSLKMIQIRFRFLIQRSLSKQSCGNWWMEVYNIPELIVDRYLHLDYWIILRDELVLSNVKQACYF